MPESQITTNFKQEMARTLYYLTAFLLMTAFTYSQSKETKKMTSVRDVLWIDDTDTLLEKFCLDRSSNKFATYINVHHNDIAFYRYKNGRKIAIGRCKITLNGVVGELRLEDMNGDGVKEMMLCTSPNMNGNRWIQVFIYNKNKDSVELAGDICTNYTVNKSAKTVDVYYTGSWYMDVYKEIYKWYGYRLVPEKKVVLSIVDQEKSPDSLFILYYCNPTPGKGKLKLVSKDVYDEKKTEHLKLWDNFFDSSQHVKRIEGAMQ